MKTVDRLLNAVNDLALSPNFHHFVIGYTSQSAQKRGSQYRTNKAGYFDHLVVLADKMTQDEALNLEEELDKALRSRKHTQLYERWNTYKKNNPYRRGAGGLPESLEPIHSVYVAWCSEYDPRERDAATKK